MNFREKGKNVKIKLNTWILLIFNKLKINNEKNIKKGNINNKKNPIPNQQIIMNNQEEFDPNNNNINIDSNYKINEMNEKIDLDSINLSKKTIIEILKQNNCMREDINTMQCTIDLKDKLISEFESLVKVSKDKLTKYSDQISSLQNENNSLRQQLNSLPNNYNQDKFRSNKNPNPNVKLKGNPKEDDNLKKIENEYYEKEINLTLEFKQKDE